MGAADWKRQGVEVNLEGLQGGGIRRHESSAPFCSACDRKRHLKPEVRGRRHAARGWLAVLAAAITTTPPSSSLPSSKPFHSSNPNRPPLQPACCCRSSILEPTWNPSPVPTMLLLGMGVPHVHLQSAHRREPSASAATSMLSAHLSLCRFLTLCNRGAQRLL